MNEYLTLLNGDEFRAGCILRAFTIRLFIILILLHSLNFAEIEFHDHVQEAGKFFAFHSQLVKLVLSFHRNLFQSILTATDLKNADETD